MSWEPIETAPRDIDSLIVVWRGADFPEDAIAIVAWDEDSWVINDGKQYHSLRGPNPTHWMPLPAPPSADPGIPVILTREHTDGPQFEVLSDGSNQASDRTQGDT